MLSLKRKLYGKASARLWRAVDRTFLRHAGGDERPVFFDVDEVYPSLRNIDANYDAIRSEIEPVLERITDLPRYHDVDASQRGISDYGLTNWRTLFIHLKAAGKSFPNRRFFPRTAEVLDSIPEVGQAFLSILEPRKSVPAHEGPHHYYLRYHTAFRVPSDRPPSIRVKDQHYTWKERESVFFDDSWEHEVFNESDEMRVVLITDVIRPVPAHLRGLLALARHAGRGSVAPAEWPKQFEKFTLPAELFR